ncbi:MAG TPA: hypothetical protein DCE71_04280 [Parachlamydiales bacterium]|nr:hypothetical protein [Parachlamydiales bacterium]
MVDQVSGNQGMGPLSPQDKRAYEAEYKHGVDLFKRALDDYSHSKNMFQKAEFKEVMEKAMQVLNETAAELKKKDLLKQNETLSKDLAAFESQDDAANTAQLMKDLNKAKRSL